MLPPPPVLAPPVGVADGAGDTVATAVAVGVVGVGDGVGVQGVFGFLQGFFDVVAATVALCLQGFFVDVHVGLGLGDQELSSLPLLFQLLSSSPFPLPWPATETLALVLAVDSVLACAAVPDAINAVTPMAKQPAATRIRPAIPTPPLQDCPARSFSR
jgi:hypothetical protein